MIINDDLNLYNSSIESLGKIKKVNQIIINNITGLTKEYIETLRDKIRNKINKINNIDSFRNQLQS